MNKIGLLTFSMALMLSGVVVTAADYTTNTASAKKTTYKNDCPHAVVDIPAYGVKRFKKPKNVVLLIGDGMGVAQVYAGITANRGELNISQMRHIGFSQTASADNYITDSAAGGTAMSCGKRTDNGKIAVDQDDKPLKSILKIAEEQGKATGLIATSTITHATPASFIANNVTRGDQAGIASDFLKTDIDLFIGGGRKYFDQREDGRNLVAELKEKGYQVVDGIEAISEVKAGKLAGFIADDRPGKVPERKGQLLTATQTGLNILDDDKDGFFVMIEGSQIDWGGHAQDITYITTEMLEFDQVVGEALRFAAADKETLVIVTADHETSGLAITGGDMNTGEVSGVCPSNKHTAIMVPVFAYGPGAELFMGIYDNTAIFDKINALIK